MLTIRAAASQLLERARAPARAAGRLRFTVDGRPLRFAHFEGFDPVRPFLLAPGADRVRVERRPGAGGALRVLRRAADRERGWRDPRRRADVGPRAAGRARRSTTGSPTCSPTRRGRRASTSGPRSTPEGAERVHALARAPAPHGARAGVNRYLYAALRRARRTCRRPIRTSTAPTARASRAGPGSSACRDGDPGAVPAAAPRRASRARRRAPRRTPPAESRCRAGRKPASVRERHRPLSRHARAGRGRARLCARRSRPPDIPVSTSTVDVQRVRAGLGGGRTRAMARVEYADRRARLGRVQPGLHQRRRAAALRRIGRRGLLPGAARDRRLGLGDRPRPGALGRGLRPAGRDLGVLDATSPRTSAAAAPIPVRARAAAGVRARARRRAARPRRARRASASCSCSTSSARSSARTRSA